MSLVPGGAYRRLRQKSLPVLIGLTLFAWSTNSFAQSAQATIANAATGRSLADAVDQNLKVILDRDVLGEQGDGNQNAGNREAAGGTSTAGGAAAAVTVFPTGRLRASEHQGLRLRDPAGTGVTKSYSYDTDEASAFANVNVSIPGTILGGQVKIGGLVGHNWLGLELKPNAIANAPHGAAPGQIGSAANESVLFGGSALWSRDSAYVLASLVGHWGETRLVEKIDNCVAPGSCQHDRYRYNTAGYMATLTAGKVFQLTNSKSGPMLDFRSSFAYSNNFGSRFVNVHGDDQAYTFSTKTVTSGVTLFANMALQDNAVLRPYVNAYVRREWGYHNDFDANEFRGPALGQFFGGDQAHVYGGLDAGISYVKNNVTVATAIYYERSTDEKTLGGRLGVSWKLDAAGAGKVASASAAQPRWAGYYIGANAGYAAGASSTNAFPWCGVAAGSGYFCDETGTGLATAAAVSRTGSGSMEQNGFVGGIQTGANWQIGNFVYGVEADINSYDINAKRLAAGTAPGLGGVHTITATVGSDWLFTARGRLGWADGNALFYATGGLAMTNLKIAASYRDNNAALGAPGATMDSANNEVRAGLTAGAGVEWALDRNWSVKGEYLYVDFGRITASGTVFHPGTFGANPYVMEADMKAHLARLGLNYRF
jgi:outer membrane immunogenic protein